MTDATAVPLPERVRSVLLDAADVYAGTPWAKKCARAADGLASPLRVALAGRVKAGKSTLLNALVGQAVAATDAGECTRVVTEYSYGEQDAAVGVPAAETGAEPNGDRRLVPLPVHTTGERLVVDLGGQKAETFARLLVTIRNPRLRGLTVIDTPGLSSLSVHLGVATQRFLYGEDDDEDTQSPDAVIYLMRQLHVKDADFLEAFRDPATRSIPPVNAVGVLSRADEIGGGREDALDIARQIAADYSEEPRLRPFVQTVIPVSGLIAEAAVLLAEDDYADLARLAALPIAVTDALTISADRFAAPSSYIPMARERRSAVLARLGLFGVREALTALRLRTADSRDGLAHRLTASSGVADLQAVLRSQILGRRDALKADAAFRLLTRAAFSTKSPASRRIAAQMERLRMSVLDFKELRLLNDLRLGDLDVDDTERVRIEALLGAAGGDVRTRLGLPPDTPEAETRDRLLEERAYWQRIAVDMWDIDLGRAARTLQETLDALRRRLPSELAVGSQ